jgi:hypothetical protein
LAIGHRFLCIPILITLTAFPAFAQQAPATDPKIDQLEKKLDELLRQAAEIRQQLDSIKGSQPEAVPDLTKVEVPPAAATAATSTETPAKETPPPALTDVQTVENVPNPGASKVFNPDVSVIGNFFGKAGQKNTTEFGEERPSMQLEEAEVAFEAFVDPYAKAKFFLAAGPNGLEVEEGYANFIALPKDFTAKVGKMKATFGKANTWHTHVRPWVDQPLVIHNFFGDEQLADNGISVSRDIANPYNVFIEATGEVFSGSAERVFERVSDNDLFYNGHLKLFRELNENQNVELGTSYARGTLGEAGSSSYGGVDVTYRWKPLQQGLYRGFIGRFEGMINDNPLASRNLKGFYASGDYQLGQRWFAGARIDAADRLTDGAIAKDRGVSATLTFWPSEFSQLRTQLRRTKYGFLDKPVNELLLQLQFAIGAHGAHTF